MMRVFQEIMDRDKSENGAALLSVLMIVAAMSVAALVAVNALRQSVTLSKSMAQRSITEWDLTSAEETAAILLTETIKLSEGHISQDTPGFKAPLEVPAGSGLLTVWMRDGSNCFNLNSLMSEAAYGAPLNDDTGVRFQALLMAAGLFDGDAKHLAETLSDWLDSDTQPRVMGAEDAYYQSLSPPYRTASQPLDNISELRAIAGYTPEIIQQIKDLVCVRPDVRQTPLNINTLRPEQAPLLIALFSDALSLNDAEQIIDARPVGGWTSVAEFLELGRVKAIAEDARKPSALSISSQIFEMRAELRNSDIAYRLEAQFGIDDSGKTETLWRSRKAF